MQPVFPGAPIPIPVHFQPCLVFKQEKLTPRDLFSRLVSFKAAANDSSWCSNWDFVLGVNKRNPSLEHVFLKCKKGGGLLEPNNPYAITKTHFKPELPGGCECFRKAGTAAQHEVITLDGEGSEAVGSSSSSSKRGLVQSSLDRFNPAPAQKAAVVQEIVSFFFESMLPMRLIEVSIQAS